jgi:hypothetical protein
MIKYNSNPKISDNLIYFLTGLIEGDGTFQSPKPIKSNNLGRGISASIQVIFAKKDKPSALLLSSIFGGNVYDSKKNKL